MNPSTPHYDVFISSKSEDYPFAEEVYDFLEANGVHCFLASRELDKIGEAQYANAIDDALDCSEHMIVVASSAEHIKSKWVQSEWGTFVNDLRSNYRNGNLVNILCGDIKLRDLPPRLRHQQTFPFDSFRDHILFYVGKHGNSRNSAKGAARNTKRHKHTITPGYIRAIVVPVGGLDGNKLWDGTEEFFLPRDWEKGDPLPGFPGDTASIPEEWIVEVPGEYDEDGKPMIQLVL